MKKIFMNLGPNAFRALGVRQYSCLLVNFFLSLPQIIIKKDLTALDKKMYRKLQILFEGHKFMIDCKYVDEVVKEDSYTFGIVREIYIRNCYFKQHSINCDNIHTVIDLGGNRGAFSLLAASFAKKVIYVEAMQKYREAFIHNMEINNFNNYTIENVFIGNGGSLAGVKTKTKTLEDIIKENSLDIVDFLKIDIEGSEFGLFKETNSLAKVKYLSMEVHKEYGDITEIIGKLRQHGFHITTCNSNFDITNDMSQIHFLYAANQSLIRCNAI